MMAKPWVTFRDSNVWKRSKVELGMRLSVEEKKRLKQEFRQITMGDVSQFMEHLPRDLLRVLRTDGLLRAIVSKLGVSQRVRVVANAKHALKGLIANSKIEANSRWYTSLKMTVSLIYLRFLLEVMEMRSSFTQTYKSLRQLFTYWISKLYYFCKGPIP